MSEEAPLIAAIEAGGTKFVCAVGTGPHDMRDVTRIPTTTPEDTLAGVTRFLSMAKSKYGSIAAIGIGSFGPIDLDRKSETYGYITSTPKPGWQFTNIVPKLQDRYHVPVAWDTDVNAAVLGEYLWGAGQDTDPLIYITVGTGVGGGVLVNGQLLHGLLHPEIGHLLVPPPQNSSAIQQACHCPFHKSCVEGYICGPALASRWGVKAEALPPDHPAWEEVADVMAHALLNLTLSICPKRIILGGGVMSQEHILPLIRGQLHKLNNGYLRVPELGRSIDDFIVAPGLGARSGLLGALALGKYELDRHLKEHAAAASV
ncbi:ROK family protein [Prosthecobacter sp.]|uniref:ROK family protein n=1 Tax=Prosthecobacter sp. TaxID=1965333 RepID=UPI0037833F9D